MALVKIKDDTGVWMHDQFHDLGRDMVHGGSVRSRKRIRLREHDEVLEVY